jgi:hypothetical protein
MSHDAPDRISRGTQDLKNLLAYRDPDDVGDCSARTGIRRRINVSRSSDVQTFRGLAVDSNDVA